MLAKINPQEIPVIFDFRYASTNNVCGQKLYQEPQPFLHIEALEKLKIASQIAQNLGYKIKIWDAFRPLKVQEFMFNHFAKDELMQSYFSDPKTGSVPHCRGVAVDLTLVDKDNNELPMGSDFDELSELANHNCNKISKEQQHNRLILLGIMTLSGFDFYSKEWWHYQLFNPRQYKIFNDEIS
jgi:D-alanyl-D-alanine dipeptidase